MRPAGRALSTDTMHTEYHRRGSHRVTPRKRRHVDHWQSAVPPSLSEAAHGPWHELSNGLSNAATFPPKRQMTEETIPMKAIVVTDQAAGTAGMKLVERPEPQASINDVIVQVHASGFVPTELAWPST